jgi:hypothetical protein
MVLAAGVGGRLLFVGASAAHDHVDANEKSSRGPARRVEPGVDDGSIASREELLGVEGMHEQPIGDLGHHARHPRADGTDPHGRCGPEGAVRVEQRWHERVGGVASPEVERCAPIASSRNSALTARIHSRIRVDRMVERRAVAALDVGSHLRAQAEREATLGQALQIPGEVGEVHGAAGEGDGHVGVEVEVADQGGLHQGEEHVPGPSKVKAPS